MNKKTINNIKKNLIIQNLNQKDLFGSILTKRSLFPEWILKKLEKLAQSEEKLKSATAAFSICAYIILHQNEPSFTFHQNQVFFNDDKSLKINPIENLRSQEKGFILKITNRIDKFKNINEKILVYKKNNDNINNNKFEKINFENLKIIGIEDLMEIEKSQKFHNLPTPKDNYIWIITEISKEPEEESSFNFFKKIKRKEKRKRRTESFNRRESSLMSKSKNCQNNNLSIFSPNGRPGSPKFNKIREFQKKKEFKLFFSREVNSFDTKNLKSSDDSVNFFSPQVRQRSHEIKRVTCFKGMDSPNSFSTKSRGSSTFQSKINQQEIPKKSKFRINNRRATTLDKYCSKPQTPVQNKKKVENTDKDQIEKLDDQSVPTFRRKSFFNNPSQDSFEKKKQKNNFTIKNEFILDKQFDKKLLASSLKDSVLEDLTYQLKKLNERIEFLKRNGNRNQDVMKISILKIKAGSVKRSILRRYKTQSLAHWRPVSINGVEFDDISSYKRHSEFIENSRRYKRMNENEMTELLNSNTGLE